jgi:hypothetical protein
MAEIYVEWTGSYPNLCSGKWIITIDGIKLTGIGKEDFGTLGEYSSWHFENWIEVFDSYEDGMDLDAWIQVLKTDDINGLYASLQRHGIKITDELLSELYTHIQGQDWRHGSCGGCI